MEAERDRADMQHDLAGSEVGMQIAPNRASARKSKADGEAAFIRETGTARGAEFRAVGLARAEGYEAQRRALGESATAVINSIDGLSRGQRFVPEILVTGGASPFEAIAAGFQKIINNGGGSAATPASVPSPASHTPPAAGEPIAPRGPRPPGPEPEK
ncbi:MAG TPA: hypothetical protein VFE56_01140 [Candidatus Binataceae bacterium]|nr:hypothetical protein [Candidatus Binataceae bacterium]